MKIAFFGSPEFALSSLKSIYKSEHRIIVVVSQPDKPRGRGKTLKSTEVSAFAKENKLKLLTPNDLNNEQFIAEYKATKPEINIVIAYGKILPQWLIELPGHKTINAHASLLPKYRGAAPITRALMEGEKETGVTVAVVAPEIDAGDIIVQEKIKINHFDNNQTLSNKLADLSADLLLETLDLIKKGKLPSKRQEPTKVSYANKITKDEYKIDFNNEAKNVVNKIRALAPKPGAYTVYKGKRLKLLKVKESDLEGKVSQVIKANKFSLIIGVKGGSIQVLKVQLEGKKTMNISDFLKGHKIEEGDILNGRNS